MAIRTKHYKDHIKINYKLLKQVNRYKKDSKANINEYLENFLIRLYSNFIGDFIIILPYNK